MQRLKRWIAWIKTNKKTSILFGVITVLVIAIIVLAVLFSRSEPAPTTPEPAPAPEPTVVSEPTPAPTPTPTPRSTPATQLESVSKAEFQEEIARVDSRIDGVDERLVAVEGSLEEINTQLGGIDGKLDQLIVGDEEAAAGSSQAGQTPIIVVVPSSQQPYPQQCYPYPYYPSNYPYQQQSYWPYRASDQFHVSVYDHGTLRDGYQGWFKDDCINYRWGSDGLTDFDLEEFSLTIQGEINAEVDGAWVFYVDSDDGDAKLYVNNTLTDDGETVELDQGDNQIKVRYTHDGGGDAYLRVWWQRVS